MKNDSTAASFHVHEILNFLSEEKIAMDLSQIQEKVIAKFGPNATFSSCSQDGMDPEQAINFLLMRQKLQEVEPKKFLLNTGNSCGH